MGTTAGKQTSQRLRPALPGRRNGYLLAILVLVTLALLGMQSVGRWFGLAVPDRVVLSLPLGDPQSYPAVPFSHRDHARFYRDAAGEAIACVVCHHSEEGEPIAPPPLCSECHGTLDNPVNDNPLLMHIFHLRCVQCHRDVAATGRASGPTTDCSACHRGP